MKKRTRHFSKSTLSIVLSLCMLISCVSVGLIATDAARISAGEKVGWAAAYSAKDYYNVEMQIANDDSGDWSNDFNIFPLNSSGICMLYMKNNYSYEFKLKADNGKLWYDYENGSSNPTEHSASTTDVHKSTIEYASGNHANMKVKASDGEGWYIIELTSIENDTSNWGWGDSYPGDLKWKFYKQTTYDVKYLKGTYGTGTEYTDAKTKDIDLTLRGAIFTRTGYTQTAWASNTAGTTRSKELGATYSSNEALTLYPYWTPNEYTITYKDGGDTAFSGTHESGYPTTHTYGTATNLKTATKTGYTFGGWFTNSACTGSAVTSLGATAYTSNITLYAKWTINSYDITFAQPEHGSIAVNAFTTSPVSVNHGTNATVAVTPASGYKIKTLTDNGNAISEAVGSTSEYNFTISNVKEAHTITAVMESAGICGFELSDTSASLDIGGTTTFTATPNAYHVGGTISAVSSDTSIATVSRNNNTYTVTAKKHGTATITVSCTEGGSATFTVTVNTPTISISADETELNIGETATLTPTVTHKGTATVSYHSNQPAIVSVDGSGKLKALKPGTANITATVDGVSSTYITVTVNTPSLTFSYTPSTIYVDGDTAEPGTVTANNANADSTISTLTYAVTSGGTSGSVAVNGTVTSDSAAGTVTVRVTGTVSYNGVSYTGATGTSNITVRERESVYLLGLTNEGSWDKTDDLNKMTYDSADGLFKLTLDLYQASTTYQDDNGFKISVDDTQYGGNYTINGMQSNQTTLSSSGGNLKITTKNFSSVTSSTVPYKFTYSVVTKELTVYYPMTVAFNANGHGTAPAAVVAAYGSTIDTPTAPTADGYTFAGWYKEAACENAFNFATDTVTQDTTLYAKWNLNSYRLTKGQETHGTFTLSPAQGDVPYQTSVTVTCTPELGYKVSTVKYGEESAAQVSGSSSQWTFNMPNADTTVNVTFVKENYNITKEVSPSDAGSVSVKKSGSETGTYQIGDYLVLAATPDATHRFTNFIIQYSDNTTATITDNNKTVSMAGKTGAITVTANFDLKTNLPVPAIKVDNATPTQSNPLEKDISETVTITITNYDTLKTYCDLTVYYGSTVLSGVTFNSSGEATITFPDNAAGYKGENKNYYVKAAVKSAYSADYMINNAASANSNNVYIKVYKPLFELAGNVDLILNSGKNSAQWGSGQTGTSTGITIGTPVANRHGVYSYTFKVTGTSGNAYFEFCAKSGTNTRKALKAHDGTYYNKNGSNLDVSNGLEESDCAYIQTVDGDNPGGGFMVARGKTYIIYIDQTNNDDTNTDKVGSFWIENLSCYIGSIAKAQTFNLATDQYNAVTDATSSQGTVTAPTDAVIKGQSATVTATPVEGYHFAGWYSNENCTGTRLSENSSYTFTVTEDVTYYALFQQTVARKTVTVVSVDHVTVTASYCSHSADEGESMEIPVGATVNYTIALDRGCQLDEVSPSNLISLAEGTNSFTMPAVDVTITITASKTLYDLRGVVSPNKGSIHFYDSNDSGRQIYTATYNQLVYVEYTPDEGYLLKNFTYEGNGITEFTRIGDTNVASFRMGDAAATVTAHVVMQSDITYYVDLHNNSVESLEFAIVTSATGNEVQTDYKGDLCEKTLSSPLEDRIQQLQNSSVYSATISTPVTKSGPMYSNVFIRIKLNGKSYVTTLNGNQVAAMLQTQTVWLEAVNETSQELKLSFATNTTSAVESGKRRIYLAKPYSWNATSESGWENIGIYYWGDNPIDIGWNNGIKMHYLGYDGTGDDGTKYYYADIPKAILDAQNNKSYTVHSIIFQGWGSNTAAGSYSKKQTSNIESIGDANFFVLSKDGSSYVGTPGENVVIPGYTRHTSSVKMNIQESKEINITPTYTGGDVVFESGDTEKLEVNNGVIVPHASTVVGDTNAPVTITVTVRGTIGAKNLTGGESGAADAISYQVPVELYDPTKFQGFNAMSFQTATYTVQIKSVEGTDNPGYFNMNAVSIAVSGIKGNDSLRKSAIITPGSSIVVDSETKYTSFTVMYAKTNTFQNVNLGDYTNIKLVGDVETLSITQTNTGKRYGHKEWRLSKAGEQAYTNPGYKTTTSISNKVEMAKTSGIIFTDDYDIYTAFFEEYQYVDVTFTFIYDVYKPEVVTINKATGLPLTPEEKQDQTVVTETRINYPYDAEYAEQAGSHETITVQVKGYEVRGKISPANNNSSGTKIARENLKIDAIKALGSYTKNNTETLLLNNNYYNYEVDDTDENSIIIDTCEAYTADVTVNLTKSPKTYNVYLWNGTTWESKATDLTYQAYADVSVPGSEKVKWYAVSEDNRDTDNAPLLANDTGYRFRVKGDTYLVTKSGTISDDAFNRSEVDFSHYEIAHKEKVIGQTTQMTEYLRQNFYIADFFAPSKVFDPNTAYEGENGETKYLPYDEVNFVGGGVVYYSVKDDVPFSNAVSAGYVDGDTGKVNPDAIKEMLKSKIEAQYAKDNLAGVIGEEDAMKVAYGTEIPVTKNVEGGFNTGIFYRYLPMETYTRDTNGNLKQENGVYTLDKTTNVNTFRYSNTLQSYQYVYASGNENKATNDGKNMRLYSYYVYSYLTYNQDTNLPETKYEIVLSDNYADASTYWAGN